MKLCTLNKVNKNFKIIDNFLEKEQFKYLQSIIFSNDIAWFYNNSLNLPDDGKQQGFYNHSIYNDYKFNSPLFENMNDFLKKLNIVSLIEIRINSMHVQKEHYESYWHTDRPFKCKTGIFYLNTCNGKTKLKTDPITKVDSVENRMLIFDSRIEHKAISQTDTKRRIVINFNYYDNPCTFTIKQ